MELQRQQGHGRASGFRDALRPRVPVTVVRYFNVYGPRQNPIFVISQSTPILNGREPLLYDSGEQTRCFTYVDDAVAGTLLAADSDAAIGEAFNVGSMTETTCVTRSNWRSRSRMSTRYPEPRPSTQQRPTAVVRGHPRRIPDSTKAQRELGWTLEVDVEEGIRRTIEWARANPWYLK